MSGKFISTKYSDTLDAVTDFNKEVIKNDFYQFNTQGKGTKVTYYHINKNKTTLDQGSGLSYEDLGEQSPIRFDRIKDLLIFQFNRQDVNFANEEFGLEAEPIQGESYILPNVLEPTEGDFFIVNHMYEDFLFKVIEADRDTLANMSNAWKITWKLDRISDKEILQNVVDEYNYIEPIIGSDIKPVVLSTKLEKAKKIEQVAEQLISYFRDLFYSEKIQTFTYKWYTESNMYDPFAIEFIIRNDLLSSSIEDYLYVQHQTRVPNTFAIDYQRSIYHVFEERDKSLLFRCKYTSQADLIEDKTSIFNYVFDNYYALNYKDLHQPYGPFNAHAVIPILDQDMIDRIERNEDYPDRAGKGIAYRNIIIKYFNNRDIDDSDLDNIKYIDFQPSNEIFYDSLFLIYVLYRYEKELLR